MTATKGAWRLLAGDGAPAAQPERVGPESGLIKSTPQKIIAQGTDWRFLDELKRELKA